MSAIPLYVVSGYLGSGKTTLVNHLLRSDGLAGRRVAVIVNEFGPLGVDGALIDASRTEQMYEINKGSMFCSCTQSELVRVVREIAEQVKPDVVLIEATGVAMPSDVLGVLTAATGVLSVACTLAVVDVRTFPQTAAFLQAAREQVAWADGVVLNKRDLATDAQLQQAAMLAEGLNAGAPQTVVAHGQVAWSWVAGLTHQPRTESPCDKPPVGIVAKKFECSGPVDRASLEGLIAELGPHLLRLKGNIDLGQGARCVQWAGGPGLDITDAADLGGSSTQFTVITWNLQPADVATRFGAILPDAGK